MVLDQFVQLCLPDLVLLVFLLLLNRDLFIRFGLLLDVLERIQLALNI